jgi:FG-GAP-like repeat
VAVGDFNGDGLLDLGVTSNTPYYESDNGYANVLLGNGHASFSRPNVTPLGYGHAYAAVAADLDGDACDDFVTVSNTGWYSYVSVLMGQSSGYLQGPSSFATGDDSVSVTAGDLNADGDTDLVTANFNGDNVNVLLGDGAGSFSAARNYATGRSPAAVGLGDFSGDADRS